MAERKGSEVLARAFWAGHAERFALASQEMGSFYQRRAARVAQLIMSTSPQGSALDIGCGVGWLALHLAGQGRRVRGIDLSPRQVEVARAAARSRGFAASCEFSIGDLQTLAPSERFDVVAAIGVLPYVADQGHFLVAALRRLTVSGLVVVSITRPVSLFTFVALGRHLRGFAPTRKWWWIAANLLRTGIWSGGFAAGRGRSRLSSPGALDTFMADRGLERAGRLSVHNLTPLDEGALTGCLEGLAWSVVLAYRRRP